MMKKSFLLWLIAIISLLILTSCKYYKEEKVEKQPQQEQTASVDVSNKSDNSNETKKTVIDKYILQESDIAQFPEVPEWKPEEMEEQIGLGRMVPQFLIDIYEKSGLDGKRMEICLPNGKNIISLCLDNHDQYYFSYSVDGAKIALFKNENRSITVLKEIRGSRKLLGYGYLNNGTFIRKCIHMDYIDNADVKLIDYADDFTIIYYPETSEAVCIRYGKEIGPRTKIDPNLLIPCSFSNEMEDGTVGYNNSLPVNTYGKLRWLTIGFINEGRLIYPIILKNGEEVSFHLYVATVFDGDVDEIGKISIKEAGNIEIDGIRYGVYQGNAYIIQNVTKQERSSARGTRLIVEDTEIHLQVQEVKSLPDSQETETPLDVQEVETLPEIQDTETIPEV